MMSDLKCSGSGSSKKAAKKQAAEKMLSILQVDGDDYDTVDTRVSTTLPHHVICLCTYPCTSGVNKPNILLSYCRGQFLASI